MWLLKCECKLGCALGDSGQEEKGATENEMVAWHH